MSGDSGDSSSDFSAKPSCSRRITTRRSKNVAAATASGSTTAASGGGGGRDKKKRRIVMRIEFDDDSESSASSSSTSLSDDTGRRKKSNQTTNNYIADDDEDIKPCSSRKLRGKLGKNKNFVFSSDDDDDDDDGVLMPGGSGNNRRRNTGRRNRQRLEDDNDDDDDHEEEDNAGGRGCSNGREIARTVRTKKQTVISEDEDDDMVQPSSSQQLRDDENGFNSDSSSNELLEKCPICLLTFRTQEIGSPATCEHIFCANCIEAWSKNVQTCPIDRIEFDRIIVRESYENRELVREINVCKTNGAEKLNQDLSDEDVTHCEVCNRPDREEVMLLCDSCNQGYHIDCLSPPLSEIPEGSWYCDNCFDSENGENSDMAEDLNELYEDIRDMGIPDARYVVTEVHQPRILRTRQNERIRAAILSRTRSSARNQVTDDAPSSSRTASTSRSARTVRNATRATRTPKTRRRRRRRARQRTYVVEYDLNNFDEKFAIKTTKRVIKRRRRRRTRRTTRSCRETENSGERMTASRRLAEQLGVKPTDRESRLGASQTFSLFGNANDLEYFSESDDGGGLQSEIQIETGGGGTAVQTSVRISNFRTQRNKKGLLSRLEREQPSSTPDLLSNIMDLQDRWHNASRHLGAVRIGQDGSLNLPPPTTGNPSPIINPSPAASAPGATETQPSAGVNSSEITQAPMYPRGGGGNNRNFNSGGGNNSGSGGGGNYNNRYNNQSNYRGSGSGGGQYRSSFGSNSSSGTGSGSRGGGNLFNMVGRGNFSFSSPNFNQNNQNNQDNDNNSSNNTPNNRDRFNQRNNNRNNRNSLPLFNNNQSNDNAPSLNANQPPIQPLMAAQRTLLPIQTVSNVQPQQQFQISTHQQHQSAPIQSLQSMPLQPPVGLFNNLPPTSGPPPLFGPPNLPPAAMLNQPPPIMPMRQQPQAMVGPSLPPLAAPPAFNSSLFQLTADYANDDDDDSNCPNFSVYSMESLQVAKSDVKAAHESKGETPKEDDENEDLVQLSDDDEMMGTNDDDDDDEIPLPPTDSKNDSNADDDSANKESDLYEPDQPTVESDDDTADGDRNKEDNESQTSPENDEMELESQDTAENLIEPTNSEMTGHNHDEEPDKDADAMESANATDGKHGEEDDEDDDDEEENVSLSDIKLPEDTPKPKRPQRKGVLELYDDSDWEELNMEKPTLENIRKKTPPQDGQTPDIENENHDEEDDDEEMEDDGKEEDRLEENEELSPTQVRTSSPVVEGNIGNEEEEDREQDRSYTPCLDEKNDNIEEEEEEEGTCTPELAGPSTISTNLNAPNDGNTPEHAVGTDAAGIGGMETELISEEDDADKRDKNKRAKGAKEKEQFKKISKNQKDRNYRSEKQLNDNRAKSSRRRRSRSRTNDKENQGMAQRRAQRGRFKRRELPRYNVRNVVNQQRSFKDRYGRDTSRPARSTSRTRRRRSFSRSVSRSKSRSRSQSTPAKRARRSFSISPTPPRYPVNRRQTMSPRRRSRSPITRTPIRRQSRTPLRMRSRSSSPIRRLNKHKPKRGPGKRSVSPVNRARSLSRFTPRLSRSRTPPRHKVKRPKDRKKKKSKKRQASPSPRGSHSRVSRHRDSMPPSKRKRHHTPKDKSPAADQGWSPSPSPPRNYIPDNNSWTPPLMSPAGVSRLRRNEEYNEFSIPSKPPKEKKKRDKKKKKSDKRRTDTTRKDKRRRDPGTAPSKEVFASGNNILVSVSFNKEGNQPQQTTVVTLPPTREEVLASIRGRSKERQTAEQQGKKKKKKDGRERKRKKLDTKPVAIIDLERSPFQVTQEQADVIVLTDSEGGGNDDENLNVSRESANEMMTEMDHHHPREGSSHRTVNSDKTPPLERLETIMEESYENAIQQQGPKTPPEPPGGIKFNLINKNKQKVIRNALHDEAELESDGQQEEERPEERDSMAQNANKIGPNTPPESGPCSPDVYDPFDPTKSPSMSPRSITPPPDMLHDSAPETDVPSKHSTEDLRTEPRMPVSSGPAAPEKSALNPVDLVMALMNNKTTASQESTNKSNESQYSSSQTVVNLIDENDKPEENNSNMGITVLSNVILSSGKSQHIPSISSPPLSKASSHKPPKLTNILSGLPGISNRHNNGGGEDAANNDIESPYSPGSAEYEDLFEPPPDTNGTKRRREKRPKQAGDIFESLFGSSSPPPAGAAHARLPRKHKTAHASARNKHKMIVKVSKVPGTSTDDHVKVYDDLPNSAVELQVKDKFLRKLNRQERVVEEVKLILKPRFNKKQITKDDYKEIMRRAVPKICHSKSGEINLKKIQNLIEAYVKKFRQKHKKLNIPNTGQVSSAVKCAAYLKKL